MVGFCPECNGKLSSSAASCPHCGYQQGVSAPAVKEQKIDIQIGGRHSRTAVVVAWIIGIIVAIGVIAGALQGGRGASKPNTPTERR